MRYAPPRSPACRARRSPSVARLAPVRQWKVRVAKAGRKVGMVLEPTRGGVLAVVELMRGGVGGGRGRRRGAFHTQRPEADSPLINGERN